MVDPMTGSQPTQSVAAPPWVVWTYTALSAAAIAVFAFVPETWQDVLFIGSAWAAFVFAAAALFHVPAAAHAPFAMLSGALFMGNLAVLGRRLPSAPESLEPFLPAADAIGNALYLATALLLVFRRGRHDRGGLLEAMIFSIGVGGLLCVTLILPRADDILGPARATYAAISIVLLCGVLGALIRLWQTARVHRRPLIMVLAAVFLDLVGQTALTMQAEAGLLTAQLCFMGAYTALGLFSTDRDAAELASPGEVPRDQLSPPRLVFLGLAIAAMPAAAALPLVASHMASRIMVALCGCGIAALVMLRIGMLASQRRRAEVQLQHLADHDPLTGALNRRAFTDSLTEAVDRGVPCVLAFCDVDRFKEFNERHGHAAGDELLTAIAKRLRDRLRPTDVLGRIGGDEFVVLCSPAPAGAAPGIEQRLNTAFSRPVQVEGVDVAVSVSIGMAISDGGASGLDLLQMADRRMYTKHEPRDQFG